MNQPVIIILTKQQNLPAFYFAVFTCGLLAMTCGYINGWIKLYTILSGQISIARLNYVVANAYLLGVLCAPALFKFRSRRIKLFIAAVPGVIIWSYLAQQGGYRLIRELIASIYVNGITLGAINTVLPIYVAEICSARSRGKFCISMAFWSHMGTLLWWRVLAQDLSFRWILIISAAMLGIFLILNLFSMPRTPYFLTLTGKKEEALKVLTKLFGSVHAAENMDAVENTIEIETSSATETCSLFCNTVNCKALGIMFLFAILLELGDVPIIAQSLQIMFILPGVADYILTYVSVTEIVATALTVCLVDIVGRRFLIRSSALLAGLGLAGFAFITIFAEKLEYGIEEYYNMSLGMLLFYTFAITFGLKLVPLVLISELFPTHARITASFLYIAFRAVFNRLMWLALSKTSLVLNFIIVYFFVLIFATALILYVLPETRGISFMDIQKSLGRQSR